MVMYRLFLRKVAFCTFAAAIFFCLNACFDGDGPGGFDPNDQQSTDSDKKQKDSKEQDLRSISSEKCPEVTSKSQFLNPDINYGEVVDERDGHVYKTVKIGKQTWMAENLNYAVEKSLCVDEREKNCEIYGRKYVGWGGICPEGWHVPNMTEWKELLYAAGKQDRIDAAILKSKFGWRDGGLDLLGFSVAPLPGICTRAQFLGGEKYSDNDYSVNCVTFGQLYANGYYYNEDESYVRGCDVGYFGDISRGLPVRCLKNEENEVPGPTVDTESLPFWNNETKEDFFNPSVEYGEMTDERDGQTYRTVQIGEQTWMAENLNYAYKLETLLEEEGKCTQIRNWYDSSAERVQSCDVFGRLYSFTAAMDSAGVFSDDGKGCCLLNCVPNKNVRGICPEGWRLPKDEDWNTLFETVGGADVAGKKLKSLIGWNFDENGTDDYGFSVTPSGVNSFIMHYHTGFWSGGPDSGIEDYNWVGVYFTFYSDAVHWGRSDFMHIRCLKGYTHVDSTSRYIPGIDTSTVVHGTMTDERDGQTYKTVKIGEQTWMAENLNYNYQVDGSSSKYGSISREEVGDSGVDYGRFYTWPAAMDSAGIFSDGGKGCGFHEECKPTGRVRGICPAGWHLPDSTEWKTLFYAINCATKYSLNRCGLLLKSDHGWRDRAGGFDFYGFTVMPANLVKWGHGSNREYELDEIRSVGRDAYFWTSMESSGIDAVYVNFGLYESANINSYYKSSGMSIRCVKD